MVGMTSRKEKVIAVGMDHPSMRAADMVEPLRDTPGKSARAWKEPMVRA